MTDRLIRLPEIIGDDKTGKKGLISISASAWWQGIRNGRYPRPVKLGPRTTAWRESEIFEIVRRGPRK